MFDYASSLFQMDVGTVYREPREFLSPWPNPDILVLELLGDTHLGGGDSPFLPGAFELGGEGLHLEGRDFSSMQSKPSGASSLGFFRGDYSRRLWLA